jgi:hypothetical protein
MNSYRRRDNGAQQASAMLASMVEEAIAETLAPPPLVPDPEPTGPPGADGFLADAVTFLRTRPDAAELISQLQAMLTPPAAAGATETDNTVAQVD